MPQQNNHRPPKTGPVAPTPTSPRPGAPPPDTPSPDATSPVTPSNADPLARIRNSTMKSPRGSSSSMASDHLEQQADELPNIIISEEPTSKKPRKSILKKFDDGVEYDIPGTSSRRRLYVDVPNGANVPSDSTNKRKMEIIVQSCVQSFCPKGATGKAITELAAVRTLTRDVVIVSIGKYAMEMAEGAIENLGMFNILKTFVFAGPNAEKSMKRCEFFNAPKKFETSCFAKKYVNPTDRVIEELQKYDERYHEEYDDTGDIIKVYPKFIFLISQGGEDYFFSSREPVMEGEKRLPLEEKVKIVSKFKDYNATKEQLTVVRKILSRVKAGGIINYIKNGYCHGFYMPESLDDEMADISGGPTIYPEYEDEKYAVKKIMENLGMEDSLFNEFQWSQLETPNDYYNRPGLYRNQNKMIVSVPLLFESIREKLFHYDTSTPFGYKRGKTKNIGRLFTEMLCSQHLGDTALTRNATCPLPTTFPMALISGGEFGPMDAESGGEDFKSTTPVQELMLDCLMAFEGKEPAYEFTLTCVDTSGDDGTSSLSGIVISNKDVKKMKYLKKKGREISYSDPSEFWWLFGKEENKIGFKGAVDMGTIFIVTLEKSFEEERKRFEEMNKMSEREKIDAEEKRKLDEMLEEARRKTLLTAVMNSKERKLERQMKRLREEQMEMKEVEKKKKRKRNDEDRERQVEDEGFHGGDKGEEQNEGDQDHEEEDASNADNEDKGGASNESPTTEMDELLHGDGTVWHGESRHDPRRITESKICLKCGKEKESIWRWVSTARKWACNNCGQKLLYNLPKKDRRGKEKEGNRQHRRDEGNDNEEEKEEEEEEEEDKTEPEDREQHMNGDGSHDGDNNEEHGNVEDEEDDASNQEKELLRNDDYEEEEKEEEGEEDDPAEMDKLLRGDGTVWNGESRQDPRRKIKPRICLNCGQDKDKFWRWVPTARKWACDPCGRFIEKYLKKNRHATSHSS
ncbi:hypothetical protein GCK72_011009 [Caenorhabditis remanei]|uniref:C2H2-type domain-containing protein n=1 Tax=Caenorhabditis remanei TaxID=31234 RepID=A0A6A5H6C9_CAERE|nr:hypothetical protein GCK72_011009 [Caenorhabditis remanei]KAF1762747.1 hypothetical protein GCK72_011009 [Caenorhabditis remanei]